MARIKPFAYGFLWFATMTRAQILPSQYNLTSVLSSQAQLSVFTEYVKQHPSILSQAEPGNVTSEHPKRRADFEIFPPLILHVVLAPSNAAIATYLNSTGAAKDEATVRALLSYHILKGLNSRNQFTRTPRFIPTLLSDPTYANITDGQRVEAILLEGGIVFYSGLKKPSKVITGVRSSSCCLNLLRLRPLLGHCLRWNNGRGDTHHRYRSHHPDWSANHCEGSSRTFWFPLNSDSDSRRSGCCRYCRANEGLDVVCSPNALHLTALIY
jgi:hypothetical protein